MRTDGRFERQHEKGHFGKFKENERLRNERMIAD